MRTLKFLVEVPDKDERDDSEIAFAIKSLLVHKSVKKLTFFHERRGINRVDFSQRPNRDDPQYAHLTLNDLKTLHQQVCELKHLATTCRDSARLWEQKTRDAEEEWEQAERQLAILDGRLQAIEPNVSGFAKPVKVPELTLEQIQSVATLLGIDLSSVDEPEYEVEEEQPELQMEEEDE